MFHGEVEMGDFSLVSELENSKLEMGLIAAVAENPTSLPEVSALLAEGAITVNAKAWNKVVTMIKAKKNIKVPETWKATSDPFGAAATLTDLYYKRAMLGVLERVVKNLHGKDSVKSVVLDLQVQLSEVEEAMQEQQAVEAKPVADLLPGVFKDLRETQERLQETGTTIVGVPTGLSKIDRMLGGLQPGIHVVAGEPGQGKTSLTLQIAGHAASAGVLVIFVSFEEPAHRLALRILCQYSNLEAKRYAEGVGELRDLERAAAAHASSISRFHLLEAAGRLTVGGLKVAAKRAMAATSSTRCVIIVDYLQRWAAGQRDGDEYRHIVAGLLASLREVALSLNCPVVAICSQNRPGQGRAMLTSLKESGDLEYCADTALFLVEAQEGLAVPPNRMVALCVEKNRFGDTGRVNLEFRPNIGTFLERS